LLEAVSNAKEATTAEEAMAAAAAAVAAAAAAARNGDIQVGSEATGYDPITGETFLIPVVSSSSSRPTQQKKARSGRKTANLAELQRYFNAAAEAAQEVLEEEGEQGLKSLQESESDPGTNSMGHISKLRDAGIKTLNSPSRMVALQLANGNPKFREKLRQKLEASGGINYRVDDLNSSDFRHDKGGTKKSKVRKRNYTYSSHHNGYGHYDDNNSNLIKRRRKTDLQIIVDPASSSGTHMGMGFGLHDMGPPGE